MDSRQEPLRPMRRKPVRNRFTAVECMATAAAMAMAGNVSGGAYHFAPGALGRSGCGELKPVMYRKDQVTEKGGWPDA
ncbi:MAG: hypothetical protein AB9860_00515 [Methanomassiliicoccales archaeon]